NGLLRRLAVGDVAGRARDRRHASVRAENGHEDVVVYAPALGADERHLAPDREARRDDVLDLLSVGLRMPRRIAELDAVLADHVLAALSEHAEQRFVRIHEPLV